VQLLLLGGRSGAGKTTVASAVFDRLAALDVRHAWIEGDFLDLAHPAPWRQGLHLAEENLKAVWRNYTVAGYERLVYSNTASVLPDVQASLAAALGGDVETVPLLLRASDESVRTRLSARESGEALAWHIERSAAMAARLDAEAPGSVIRIDTDQRTALDVAEEIVASVGWHERSS
jgi:broad-specificity NMP kinase